MFSSNPINPSVPLQEGTDLKQQKEELINQITYPVRYGTPIEDLRETMRNLAQYERIRQAEIEQERQLRELNELAPPPSGFSVEPSNKRRRYMPPPPPHTPDLSPFYVPFSSYVPPDNLPPVPDSVRAKFPTLFN